MEQAWAPIQQGPGAQPHWAQWKQLWSDWGWQVPTCPHPCFIPCSCLTPYFPSSPSLPVPIPASFPFFPCPHHFLISFCPVPNPACPHPCLIFLFFPLPYLCLSPSMPHSPFYHCPHPSLTLVPIPASVPSSPFTHPILFLTHSHFSSSPSPVLYPSSPRTAPCLSLVPASCSLLVFIRALSPSLPHVPASCPHPCLMSPCPYLMSSSLPIPSHPRLSPDSTAAHPGPCPAAGHIPGEQRHLLRRQNPRDQGGGQCPPPRTPFPDRSGATESEQTAPQGPSRARPTALRLGEKSLQK